MLTRVALDASRVSQYARLGDATQHVLKTQLPGMKELFPLRKDSRRLVKEFLSTDGNNVLLVPVLVFEHQQPTALSQSQRSMLEVPASTFGLPDLCLARGRTAHQPRGAACSADLYKNDIPDAPYLQGAPSSCARVWPRHDATKYRFAARRWESRSTWPATPSCSTPARIDKGHGVERARAGFTERHRQACADAAPHRTASHFFHFQGFFL